jgi:hypothetical protein
MMVKVEVRNLGAGIWRALTLPVTPQMAQTLEKAAHQLRLADQLRIQGAAAHSVGGGQIVDLRA